METTNSNIKDSTHSFATEAEEALSVIPTDEKVLTKTRAGTKAGDGDRWLAPENLLTSTEARIRVSNGGNYGFRLGLETEQGWMFCVLDVEERGVLPESVEQWVTDYSLLQWESLHEGSNRLLKVTPEAYSLFRNVSTKIDLDGDDVHELEILAPERGHALGPGSRVEHRHCSSKKPCDEIGSGSYHLESPNPKALTVDRTAGEQLLDLLDIDPAIKTELDYINGEASGESTDKISGSRCTETDADVRFENLDTDTRRRLKRAEDFAFGDQLVALREGRYKDAGFHNDRSRAEFRLAEILGWLFDDDEQVVRQVMTAVCWLNPQTNAGTRKWLERDGVYRDLTVKAACQHDTTYDPPSTNPLGQRPNVSHVLVSKVFEAIFDLRLASSDEIAQHDTIDRSKRQVQRALSKHVDKGNLQWIKDGRQTLYYFAKEFVPRDQREEYGL